jgi:hypothetical protein
MDVRDMVFSLPHSMESGRRDYAGIAGPKDGQQKADSSQTYMLKRQLAPQI